MLLSITTTRRPATDLGYLLHKHPDRFQTFDLSFGRAHTFYPEASPDCCRACLMLDVDAVGLARDRNRDQRFLLGHYVNDRPYAASSFLCVAIAQVWGSAMQGRCKDHPELAKAAIPLSARIDVLPVRGDDSLLHALFDPLGYAIETRRYPLDEQFAEWGESPYYSVLLSKTTTLAELLTHLYVLIPVFDNQKHYFVGEDELEKLLVKGKGWLEEHPEKDQIARRYLKFQSSLYREALARLVTEEEPLAQDEEGMPRDVLEQALEKPLSLHDQRLGAVVAALRAARANRVLDLGCGEGKLIRQLLSDNQFTEILGMDVSIRSLEIAQQKLKLDRLPAHRSGRIRLIHGSLLYRDSRFEAFDAATVVEVVEHLDPPRLSAFERVVFEFARPGTVVLTTPNREYNVTWETLEAGRLRHPDHRFEWTRSEFRAWAETIAARFHYSVKFVPVGPEHETLGPPTQMGIFNRE